MLVGIPPKEQAQAEFLSNVSLPHVLQAGLLDADFLNQLDPRLAAGQTPDSVITLGAGNVMTGENAQSIVLPDLEAVQAVNVLSMSRAAGGIFASQLTALGANLRDTGGPEAVDHRGHVYSQRLRNLGGLLGSIGLTLDRKRFWNATVWRFSSLVAFRSEGDAQTNDTFARFTAEQRLGFAQLVLKALEVPFPVDTDTVSGTYVETGPPPAYSRLAQARKRAAKQSLSQATDTRATLPTKAVASSGKGRSKPKPDSDDLDWRQRAECNMDNADLFSSTDKADVAEAKRICRRCPVAKECFEAVLKNREPYGTRAGMDERARRKLYRKLDAQEAARRRAAQKTATSVPTFEAAEPTPLSDDVLVGQLATDQHNAERAKA